jgi:uncharacterized membrane protein
VPRAVPAAHALDWFREAMHLWKCGPFAFSVLAVIVLVVNRVLVLIPTVGSLIAQIAIPIIACGLQYASLAADRGDRPRVAHLFAVLSASPAAWIAVIGADFVVFVVEIVIASLVTDADFLDTLLDPSSVSAGVTLALVTGGIVLSLPFMFVPYAALFDRVSIRSAYAQSVAAFAQNLGPLLVYAAVSCVLVLFGLATYGVGLVLALPLLAASAYAGWKDVFAVGGQREA